MLRFKRTAMSRMAAVCTAAFAVVSLAVPLVARAADWPPAVPLVVVPDTAAGVLPPSVTAETLEAGRWRCRVQFRPNGTVKTVALAGSFNNWNRDAMPLAGPDAAGVWSTTVDLSAGAHLYKFVVDGERWLPDPQNTESVPDGHAGQNSVLRLGRIAQYRESPAKVADGQIEALALEHQPDTSLYHQPLGDGKALLRLRTLAHDVETISAVVEKGRATDMTQITDGEPFVLWEAIIDAPVDPKADSSHAQMQYTFVLTDGALKGSGPQIFGVAVSPQDVFRTPEWAKNAIWYQIMVERFRNGDPANDREPVRPWTSEWFTPSDWEGKDGQTFYQHYVFDRQYGGDIAGMEWALPYLKKLGVNALYLMPMFKAESSHKYNAETYVHIDDHFGTKGDYEAIAATEDLNDPSTWKWTETDKRFLQFLKTAHAQGFKVIIDGVFNHVGTRHSAFQDIKEHGQKSKFADWFEIQSWEPFQYRGWAGFKELPEFRKTRDGLASAAVKEHIYNVTRRWMDPNGDGDPSDGIDGWRLDVPNEIPAPFWAGWGELVRSINPDAYITGEIWDRAAQWLDGKHFDAVMNYEFARPAVAWLFNRKLKIAPSEIDRRLRELRLAYPLEATLVLQNLLDSHDTDRVASMALNPDRAYNEHNRLQQEGVKYSNDKPGPADYARVRLAALLQMTYIGAPMVYYGDEVGVWGAADPTGRKPMLWEDLQPYGKPEDNFVMKDLLAYYRQIIALRNAHPALRTGTIQTLLTDDKADVWAFLRKDDNEQLIVVLNASDTERDVVLPLPRTASNKWKGVFNAEGPLSAAEHKLSVHVPAVGGVVLHAATPK